ncbi:MAG: hypothetical protein IT581_19385 [Verrucomicrobiales bacterium]|nr:hypothetical protein [Verrucomicrobiales bacterium]
MTVLRQWFLAGLVCAGFSVWADPAEVPGAAIPDEPKKLASEEAAPADNQPNQPYRAIVARNAFRLKDPLPPPPPPTNPPPVAEPPKIDVKLAGLAEIGGVRYAYLMVPDADRQGQFLYPSLTDNPERGSVRHGSGLEVKEINLKKQTVRLVNGGVEATLNLKEHGVKGAPTPAAKPGAPGQPPIPKPNVVPGGANPLPGAPNAAAGGGAMAEPLVFSRNPNRASAMQNNPAQGGGVLGAVNVPATINSSMGTGNLPTRPLRTDTTTTPGNAANQASPPIPVAQQYEVLIRQRQAAEAVGIQLPPIPGIAPSPDPNLPPQ